jgi:hypothetical protein
MAAGDSPIVALGPAPRAPGRSAAEALERWHEHSAFVMGQPAWQHVRAYSVCPLLVEVDDPELQGMLPEEFTGTAVNEFETMDAFLGFVGDPSFPKIIEHHELMFDAPVDNSVLIGTEVRQIEKEGTPTIKVFAFLRRRPELSREQFLDKWFAFTLANFCANEEITRHLIRYTQYPALLDDVAADGYDAAMELAFPDLAGVRGWLRGVGEARLIERQDFYDPGQILTLLTDETVLTDTAGERTARAAVPPPLLN